MITRVARPFRRAFFVGATACAGIAGASRESGAQLRASFDANAAVSQFDLRTPSGALNIAPSGARRSSRWLEQRAVGGALRYDNPFLRLSADGVLRNGDVAGNLTGGVSAFGTLPSWNGFRVAGSYEKRHVPNDASTTYTHDATSLALWVEMPKQPSWRSLATASISYSRDGTGYWLRASNRSGANTSDSLSSMTFATGVSQQLRSVVVGVSIGSQGIRQTTPGRTYKTPTGGQKWDTVGGIAGWYPDSLDVVEEGGTSWRRWPELSANVGWARGRFAFDAVVNTRARSGAYRRAVWGEVFGTAAVSSRLAFVGGIRTTAPLPGVMNDTRRVATLGMRVASPAFWRPSSPAPVRAVSRAFDVQPAGPGQYVFAMNIPNARTVELAGDFTAWEAVTLRQVNATRWEVLLQVTPGSHRCNVRIDGAEWVPPPGVPSVKDDFNGRVGLFVAD